MAKTYDSKCYELAEHFADDLRLGSPSERRAKVHELALLFQETADDFMQGIEDRLSAKEQSRSWG